MSQDRITAEELEKLNEARRAVVVSQYAAGEAQLKAQEAQRQYNLMYDLLMLDHEVPLDHKIDPHDGTIKPRKEDEQPQA